MEGNTINYEKALADLERIVREVESGELNLDELSDKLKIAKELLSVCNQRLNATEEEVKKILSNQ